MKKFFLMLIAAMMISAVYAQVVKEDEAALVYYSPKTAIKLDFTYSVETYEKGPYAEFAEAMLGAEAVTENQSFYQLQNVRIDSVTLTDYDRPHKVVSEPGIPMLLNINERGLLKGYNLPAADIQQTAPSSQQKYNKPAQKNEMPDVVPFSEEVLEAATPLAQAHAIAKQIFHLRETRMYLLNGEVEHAPADGKAMQLVLGELDKQEKALTELFIGKKSTRKEHKRFIIEPQQEPQLWFFSEENGFTDSENVDADTIRVSMKLHRQTLAAPDESKKKKKDTGLSQIVYNLPGNAEIEVTYDGKPMTKKTLPIAQLGVDVPMAKELFTGDELPVIVFSEKTGNVVSIGK